ncbi:MAG: hypothetical protein ACFFB0_10720, partial [Promethearchaeota archaeon]
HPDLESPAKQIEKSIGEKAFMIEKRREQDDKRREIHPDLEGAKKKVFSTIEKQAKEIDGKRQIDEIKSDAKHIVQKFDSEIEKIKKDDTEEE